jgi:prevent-host-death family protein
MRVGLREANQRFSSLIRAVRAGREVVLTDRGKPVAILKPVRDDEHVEAVLRRLEATGLVRVPDRYSPLPPWKPRRIRGAPLSTTLREERDAE